MSEKKVVQITGTWREYAWRRKPIVRKVDTKNAEERLSELFRQALLLETKKLSENR